MDGEELGHEVNEQQTPRQEEAKGGQDEQDTGNGRRWRDGQRNDPRSRGDKPVR
jgi:hypothetical protein